MKSAISFLTQKKIKKNDIEIFFVLKKNWIFSKVNGKDFFMWWKIRRSSRLYLNERWVEFSFQPKQDKELKAHFNSLFSSSSSSSSSSLSDFLIFPKKNKKRKKRDFFTFFFCCLWRGWKKKEKKKIKWNVVHCSIYWHRMTFVVDVFLMLMIKKE